MTEWVRTPVYGESWYWKRLWVPKVFDGDDERVYLVLQRGDEPEFWVSLNHAGTTKDDDIGPFATLDEATTAAGMLNAQAGVRYETSDN